MVLVKEGKFATTPDIHKNWCSEFQEQGQYWSNKMAKWVTLQHRVGLSAHIVARVNVCAVLFTAVLLCSRQDMRDQSPKFLAKFQRFGSNLFCFDGMSEVANENHRAWDGCGRVFGLRCGKQRKNWLWSARRGDQFHLCCGVGPLLMAHFCAAIRKIGGDDLPSVNTTSDMKAVIPSMYAQIISDYAVASCLEGENWHLRPLCF